MPQRFHEDDPGHGSVVKPTHHAIQSVLEAIKTKDLEAWTTEISANRFKPSGVWPSRHPPPEQKQDKRDLYSPPGFYRAIRLPISHSTVLMHIPGTAPLSPFQSPRRRISARERSGRGWSCGFLGSTL